MSDKYTYKTANTLETSWGVSSCLDIYCHNQKGMKKAVYCTPLLFEQCKPEAQSWEDAGCAQVHCWLLGDRNTQEMPRFSSQIICISENLSEQSPGITFTDQEGV